MPQTLENSPEGPQSPPSRYRSPSIHWCRRNLQTLPTLCQASLIGVPKSFKRVQNRATCVMLLHQEAFWRYTFALVALYGTSSPDLHRNGCVLCYIRMKGCECTALRFQEFRTVSHACDVHLLHVPMVSLQKMVLPSRLPMLQPSGHRPATTQINRSVPDIRSVAFLSAVETHGTSPGREAVPGRPGPSKRTTRGFQLSYLFGNATRGKDQQKRGGLRPA